jgi:hypothetical protein
MRSARTRARLIVAAIAVTALTVMGLGTGYAAHASVGGHVTGLSSNTGQTIAGWYATANDATVFPTHLSATLGSDGQPTLSNLTPWDGSSKINAAEGIGIGNSNTGVFAEVGLVNVGHGLMDVVADEGLLSAANGDTQTSFGWVGLVNSRPQILLADQPITESVDVDLVLSHTFSFGPVSGLTASARIAHYGNWHRAFLNFGEGPQLMDEVQSGIVNGNQPSVALSVTPSQIPLANTSRTGVPNELGRLAHVDVSANVRGGHEFRGASATGGAPISTSTAFTGYPVYTYTAVTAGEQIDLAPTSWASDNFAVEGGLPLAS